LSKKVAFILRSKISIVKAPAKTGRLNNKRKAVMPIHQTNKLKPSNLNVFLRKRCIVTKKLILPRIDLIPAQCNLKIRESTEMPECPTLLKGGYNVQLVPLLTSIKNESKIKLRAQGSNQKLKAFNRGRAISGASKNKGSSQLPKPPNKAGITIKKIITKACNVIKPL